MIDWATGGAAVRDAQSDPRTLDFLSELFGVLSDGAIALLLIAFFRAPEDEAPSEIAPSRLLRIVTRVALIVGYIALAFSVVGLLFVPLFTRHTFLIVGREPPALESLLKELIVRLLVVASMVAAPFIVSRSLPQEVRAADSDV